MLSLPPPSLLFSVSLSCISFPCSHKLPAVYYWRVISSFTVSTTRSQAQPVKHMPDQRASHRPRVFSPLWAPVAMRYVGRLTVWLANSKSMWLFKGEMHDCLTWLHPPSEQRCVTLLPHHKKKNGDGKRARRLERNMTVKLFHFLSSDSNTVVSTMTFFKSLSCSETKNVLCWNLFHR